MTNTQNLQVHYVDHDHYYILNNNHYHDDHHHDHHYDHARFDQRSHPSDQHNDPDQVSSHHVYDDDCDYDDDACRNDAHYNVH